jgi:hypothetical protein
VDYRVFRADGGPMPDWLDRVGNGVLIGQRPPNLESIQLRVIVIFDDSTHQTQNIKIETSTGEIQLMEQDIRSDVAVPFTDQFTYGSGSQNWNLDALARMLAPH